MKLNVDCSWVQGEHVGSVAGILQDQTGQVINGFMREVRASSPVQAEALAVLHGLEFLKFRKELHVGVDGTEKVQKENVKCETNSLTIEQSIMGWAEIPCNAKTIIE